jgi:hypothetical protein
VADPVSIGALVVAVASASFTAFQWHAGQESSRTTEKQRLEANAANVVVSIQRWEWPPSRPSNFVGPDLSHMEGVKVGHTDHVFRKTTDFRSHLELTGWLLIQNFSQAQAAVTFEGPFYMINEHGNLVSLVPGQVIRVPPEETQQVAYIDRRSVSEWIDPSDVYGTVHYDDGLDAGVSDWWQVKFEGSPICAVEDEVGAVQVPMSLPLDGTTPVSMAISRRHRDYYRSKVEDTKIR